MKPYYVYKVLSREIPTRTTDLSMWYFEYVDDTIDSPHEIRFRKVYEKEWFDTAEEAEDYMESQLKDFSKSPVLKGGGTGWLSFLEFQEEIGSSTSKVLCFHSNLFEDCHRI